MDALLRQTLQNDTGEECRRRETQATHIMWSLEGDRETNRETMLRNVQMHFH